MIVPNGSKYGHVSAPGDLELMMVVLDRARSILSQAGHGTALQQQWPLDALAAFPLATPPTTIMPTSRQSHHQTTSHTC
jgi:hypothetical protein